MATLEAENVEPPASTARRLRVRPKICYAKDEDDGVILAGQSLSRSPKRKAEVSLESLYRQENYKDLPPTPLETIYESPRPSTGWDASLVMARRKLRRMCVFNTPYCLTRVKMRQRKERVRKMKQLTGVRVPQGTAFSETDVDAALSCLTLDEDAIAAAKWDLHPGTRDTLVEGMIQELSSLQVQCQSSPSPREPPIEQQQQQQQRQSPMEAPSEDQVQCQPLSSPRKDPMEGKVQSQTSVPIEDQSPASPSTMRGKKMRRRSILFSLAPLEEDVDPSNPPAATTSPQGKPPTQLHMERPRRMRRKSHNTMDGDNGSTTTKIPKLRLGNKRNPDTSPATPTKKQRTPHTSPESQEKVAAAIAKGKKGRGKRRISGKVRPLYLASAQLTTSDTPPTSPNRSGDILRASPMSRTPAKEGEGSAGAPTVSCCKSPVSPASQMAALSLYPISTSPPKPLLSPTKVKKARRRSARLSLGPEVIEGFQNNNGENGETTLGSFWSVVSPQGVPKKPLGRSGERIGDPSNDPQPFRKPRDKGRRRSGLILPPQHVLSNSSFPPISSSSTTTTTTTSSSAPSSSPLPPPTTPFYTPSLPSPHPQQKEGNVHPSLSPCTKVEAPLDHLQSQGEGVKVIGDLQSINEGIETMGEGLKVTAESQGVDDGVKVMSESMKMIGDPQTLNGDVKLIGEGVKVIGIPESKDGDVKVMNESAKIIGDPQSLNGDARMIDERVKSVDEDAEVMKEGVKMMHEGVKMINDVKMMDNPRIMVEEYMPQSSCLSPSLQSPVASTASHHVSKPTGLLSPDPSGLHQPPPHHTPDSRQDFRMGGGGEEHDSPIISGIFGSEAIVRLGHVYRNKHHPAPPQAQS